MTSRTRRDVLRAGIAAGAAAAVLPLRVAADALVDDRSPLVDAGDGWLFGWDVPTDQVIYRHGQPSWIIRHDGDRRDSLDEWATEDDRYVIRHSDSVDASLVAAPEAAAHSLLESGWVESLDLDLELELVEPVTPPSNGALGLADLSRAEEFLVAGGVNPFRERLAASDLTAGLGYSDDMPDRDINDTRGYTNAVSTTVTDTAVVLDTGIEAGAVFEDDLGNTRILDASADYTDPARPTVGENGLETVSDGNSHGSWVASCVAGDGDSLVGYAPSADILAHKVLDDEGSGSSFDIAEAIRAAADHVGQGGVACLSLGSPVYSYELDQAVAYAAGAGMPCVVAAGNDREASKWVNSPADSPDAITVTAATAHDPGEAKSAAFHNHDPDSANRDLSGGYTAGSHVDVAAPGCKVLVDTPSGTDRKTGTSMAAPHVAGGLLQLFSEDGGVKGDLDVIRERLREYAAPMPAAGVTEAGEGYLDVKAMVNETEPEESQEDARDDDAATRDTAHRRLSNGEGGFIWRFR